jgi:hypothetical protein
MQRFSEICTATVYDEEKPRNVSDKESREKPGAGLSV